MAMIRVDMQPHQHKNGFLFTLLGKTNNGLPPKRHGVQNIDLYKRWAGETDRLCPPLPANAARGGFCDSSQGWVGAASAWGSHKQCRGVWRGAGAKQPHNLRRYNATPHFKRVQCNRARHTVWSRCQLPRGQPSLSWTHLFVSGFNARKRSQLYQSMGGVLHQKMVLCIKFIEWIDCSLVHPCSVSIQRRRGAQHNLDPTAARVDPLTSGCAIF